MEGRRIEERQPTGWTYFAGVVLFIVGSLDALWGLAAITNNDIAYQRYSVVHHALKLHAITVLDMIQ